MPQWICVGVVQISSYERAKETRQEAWRIGKQLLPSFYTLRHLFLGRVRLTKLHILHFSEKQLFYTLFTYFIRFGDLNNVGSLKSFHFPYTCIMNNICLLLLWKTWWIFRLYMYIKDRHKSTLICIVSCECYA